MHKGAENTKNSNKPEKGKINFNDYNLKPPASYLNDIPDFADLFTTLQEAEKAANDLLKETSTLPQIQKPGNGAPNSGVITQDSTESVKPSAETEKKAEEKPDLNELMAELDSLVGLEKIKANVKSLVNLVKVRKLREKSGLKVPPISMHLVFMGNPGTGKTTVARLIAKLYYAIGVLSKGQLVEVDRSGLVAGYIGQTAIKTETVIKSAIGGVLFIDEAYSLASGGDAGTADFGKEAIETLLKAMEDNRDDLVVVVAGYENLMEKFISSNPGLESRFNRYMLFEDYNGDELMEIFKFMCNKNQYVLNEEAEKCAQEHLKYLYNTRDDNFGNARDVRNLFENIVSVHADRIAFLEDPTRDDLMTIKKEDVEKALSM